MSNEVKYISNDSQIIFDFENENISFLRSNFERVAGKTDLTIPFSAITGIEIGPAGAITMGSVEFIINNTRYSVLFDSKKQKHIGNAIMYLSNKKVHIQVEETVHQLAKILNVPVKPKNGFNVPTEQYQGEFAGSKFYRKCNLCGNVFSYTLEDLAENKKNEKLAKGNTRAALAGALAGNYVSSNQNIQMMKDNKNAVVDYSKCPECQSDDIVEITKEEYEASLKTKHAPTTNSTVSAADELKKFKELLDMGVITQEEFDAKKKQLLGL